MPEQTMDAMLAELSESIVKMRDAMQWAGEEIKRLRGDYERVAAERDAALNRAREARETAKNYLGHCDAACKQLEVVEAERDNAVRYSELLIGERNRATADAERLQKEVRAYAAEAEAFRDLAYQVPGLQAERDAAKALAKEWEAKAMDPVNHPVVQVLLQERDAAKAEAERLKAELAAEENNCPYPDFSCGTFAAERGIELRPAGGPTYTTTIDHWQGILRDLDAARAGESRAVEALKHIVEMAYAETSSESSEGRLMRFCYAARDTAERVIESSPQPVLAWLAQRIEDETKTAKAGEVIAIDALRSVRGSIDDAMNYCGAQVRDDLKDAMGTIDGAIYAHERGATAGWLAQQRAEAAEHQRVSDSNVVRTLGPHFCDFFFGGPGEAEYLQQQLAAACREAAAEAEKRMDDRWAAALRAGKGVGDV